MNKSNTTKKEQLYGYVCLGLLALQFGLQPLLYKSFARDVEQPSTLVITCEIVKCLIASVSLVVTGKMASVWQSWRFRDSIRMSGVPACTYAVQNILVQISYQSLPPLVFNLLNQTKIIWTALSVHILLDKSFSRLQYGTLHAKPVIERIRLTFIILLLAAMTILMLAAAILFIEQDPVDGTNGQVFSPDHIGVGCVVLASLLSGLGSAFTQRSMQVQARDAALVTMELSIYGGLFVLLHSAVMQSTSSSLSFTGWQPFTFLPVLCNAFGGILVGCLTKYAGGVLKSFALVGGLICTLSVESLLYQKSFSSSTIVAAFLVAFSMIMYSTSQPPREIKSEVKKA